MQTLVALLTVTGLAPGASITLPHGLTAAGLALEVTSVMPDRVTPIRVSASDDTNVTFVNDGNQAESAIFLARRDHSMQQDGSVKSVWAGAGTSGGATTEAINLYVETTGDDDAAGTAAAPLRTIQAAVNRVPRFIRHPVNIHVGAGDFAGASIAGFTVGNAAVAADGAYLRIVGTKVLVTPATGVATGTATSGVAGTSTTWGTLTLTGAGWTPADFDGKLIEILSGTGVGQVRPIQTNTDEVVTIVGPWTTAPAADSVFGIYEWATTLVSGVAMPTTAAGASTAPPAALLVYSITSQEGQGSTYAQISAEWLKFKTVGNVLAVALRSAASVLVSNSRFDLVPYTAVGASNNGLSLESCSFEMASGKVGCSASAGMSIYLRHIYAKTTGTAQFFYAASGSAGIGSGLGLSYIYVVGAGTHFNLGQAIGSILGIKSTGATTAFSGGFGMQVNSSDISSATTAVKVDDNRYAIRLTGVTGAGNTTAVLVTNGGNVFVSSTCTLTGTTEISIDGAASDFATMRAATPKYVVDATTGSKVWGT
ncbi:MAG: hypothetical protein KJ648_07430 [Candidatus Omnitrophica bacterium]|nr:hypothetical protein [Candidatus Omnitrophota bacterium]